MGKDKSTPLKTALHEFCNELREARRLYRSSDAGRRIGCIAAVNAAVGFLRHFDEVRDEDLAFPLLDLSASLTELDYGIPSDLFEVSRRPGQRSEDTYRSIVRVFAAATAELLILSRLSAEQAHSRVARCLKGVGWRTGRHATVTASTVSSWRYKLRRGSRPQQEIEDFHGTVTKLRPLIESHPEGLRDLLVNSLREVASARGS